MSRILYLILEVGWELFMGSMSFQEKSTWVMLGVLILVYTWYFAVIFGQIESRDVREIAYRPVMLVATGALVLLAIVTHILIAVAAPSDAEQSDERDKEINRHGEYVGGYVLGIGAFGALALAMLEVDHFWIANGILAALVLSEVVSSTTRIVLYRRGM